MRAIATNRFGGNDVLELTDLPEPIVGPDTVLVRTKAVGGEPGRLEVGARRAQERFPNHFPLVPGWDVAGVVERVGPAVTEFAAGDEVMAYDREDHVQSAAWSRVRELVPEGATVIIDLVGGDALEATLDLGGDGLRLVSVTNPDRTKALGGRYVFVRPDAEQLAELGRLAADGSLKIHVRETFPFECAVEALAPVEECHGPGKVVVLFDG